MNVLFLSKYYKNYLEYFYSTVKNKNVSYEILYNNIMQDRYFWSDYFKQELPAYGYNVEQIIIDAKLLQIKWAEEHNFLYSENTWYFDIIIKQIEFYKPDILFIQDWAPELGPDFVNFIKNKYSFIIIIVGYCGEGHPKPDYFKYHDIVISCAKDNVLFFKKKNLCSYHIYHAFYPKIHDQLTSEYKKEHDVGFIGRVYPQSTFHEKRALFLSSLSNISDFNIHGEIKKLKEYSLLERFLFIFSRHSSGKINKNIEINSAVKKLYRIQKGQFFGLKMFDLIRKYRILLNYHTSPLFAANLRMFEVTGMGTCLLTDWKENIKELFEPDIEVITYRNVYEAKEKIDFLKRNPDIMKDISLAGQKRTLKDHTYKNRALDLHNIFNDFLLKKR
jgi:spore maturation protein CgeB